jgi:hypothetical protein
MASHSGLLRVSGTDVVDGNNKRVILKGVNGDTYSRSHEAYG